MKMRLRNDLIYKARKDTNRFQVSKQLGISPTTAYAILGDGATEKAQPNLDVLVAILVEGLGITPAEILQMRVGELFTID